MTENLPDCKNIEPLLNALLDNELSEEETAVFFAHLERCPACRRLQSEYRQVRQSAISFASPMSDVTKTDIVPMLLRTIRADNSPDDAIERLLAEMRSLRDEVSTLRGEVNGLRSQLLAARTATIARNNPVSTRLMPYAAPANAERQRGNGNE